jgi:hypothetical protein
LVLLGRSRRKAGEQEDRNTGKKKGVFAPQERNDHLALETLFL